MNQRLIDLSFCRKICRIYISFRLEIVELRLLSKIVDIVIENTAKIVVDKIESGTSTPINPHKTSYTYHTSMKDPVTQHTLHCTFYKTPRITHTQLLSNNVNTNKMMRIINGNGKKYLKILYQNVPSQLSNLDKLHSI